MTVPIPGPAAISGVYTEDAACAAHLLCDRHNPEDVAFSIVESDLSSENITYGQLRERSERGAAALAGLGIGPGDVVATLMGKSADLVVVLLAIWRRGAVHVPLFTAFAWPAIELRLSASGAKVIITDGDYRGKIQDTTAIVVTAGDAMTGDDLSLSQLLRAQQPGIQAETVGGDGTIVLIFTSGTTGAPKGVPVPVRALAAFQQYIEYGLDVREDDVYWNAADPGWAYGLYYAILGPLAAGRRSVLVRAGFSPELTIAVLHRFGVTNFAAAPTVYRSMRSGQGAETPELRLRRASSAGEPLTPEIIAWTAEALGVPVRDHYGQTEHGMMIANAWHIGLLKEIRPGSMGHALPGWTCTVLRDFVYEKAERGEMGRLAVDVRNSPMLWFSGYKDDERHTAEHFSDDGRWYITGDAAMIDEDGYFYFSARDDDVIIMAGYRIGPFDVESVLSKHPAVHECAVIGAPDDLRGEVVVAYVVLGKKGVPGEALAQELQEFVKSQYSAHAFPRRVFFVEELPKTPSGKIQRYILRKRNDS
ncbi:AMP-binding protein [Pseudarthrobacter siccitolerans]